jgi:hypothetical protein
MFHLVENKEINEENQLVKMFVLDEMRQVMKEIEMEFHSGEIDSRYYHLEYLDVKMEPE